MLHWYCKATYNLRQIFSPKATYNLGRREYYCYCQPRKYVEGDGDDQIFITNERVLNTIKSMF